MYYDLLRFNLRCSDLYNLVVQHVRKTKHRGVYSALMLRLQTTWDTALLCSAPKLEASVVYFVVILGYIWASSQRVGSESHVNMEFLPQARYAMQFSHVLGCWCMECFKQAHALNTLAWNNKIRPWLYFVGF